MKIKILSVLTILLFAPSLGLAESSVPNNQKLNGYKQQWQDYQKQYQLDSSNYRGMPRKPAEKKATGFYATDNPVEKQTEKHYEPPGSNMPKSQRDYLDEEKQGMFDGLGYDLKQKWQKARSPQKGFGK